MTYRIKLQQLLAVSVEKSNDYIDSVSVNGQDNSINTRSAQTDWENADNEYTALLNLMKANQADPDDIIPA